MKSAEPTDSEVAEPVAEEQEVQSAEPADAAAAEPAAEEADSLAEPAEE